MVILVADDDSGIRHSLFLVLKNGNDVIQCADGMEALAELEKTAVDVVITDFSMPKMTGLELIRHGKDISPSTAFLMMTAHGSVEQAVEAIRVGADDYLTKPFDISEIEHRIKRIRELRSWRTERAIQQETGKAINRLVGQSAEVSLAQEFIKKVADVSSPILIQGAIGSGVEIVAQAIHESGERTVYPFIVINCANLGEELVESELFGHEKGALAGATQAKSGKFELAKEGTLFFEEISDLPLATQAKLVRLLKEREFFRVGGTRRMKSSARIIAASHEPLKELVKKGKFREDLYFQLNVLSFEMPSLADRMEDIPMLIRYYMGKLTKEFGRSLALSPEAMTALTCYSYPGNLRELQNVLERLVVVGSRDATIGIQALPPEIRAASPAAPAPVSLNEIRLGEHSLGELVEIFELKVIYQALNHCERDQTLAAELLRIPEDVLENKLKKRKTSIDLPDPDAVSPPGGKKKTAA